MSVQSSAAAADIDLDPSLGRAYAGLADATFDLAITTDPTASGAVAGFGQRNSSKLVSILALADRAVEFEP